MPHKSVETIGLAAELIVSGLLLAAALFLGLSLLTYEDAWGVPPPTKDFASVALMLVNGIGGLLAGVIAMKRWQAHSLALIVGIVVIIVGYAIDQNQFFIAIYISFNLIIGGTLGLIGADKVQPLNNVGKKATGSYPLASPPERVLTVDNSLRVSRPVTPSDVASNQPDGLSPLRISTAAISTAQEKKCPKCRGMLPIDARFCNKCGFRF